MQIVLQLGEYQLQQFMNRSAIQQRMQKKDDKLEKLKGRPARAQTRARRAVPHAGPAAPDALAMTTALAPLRSSPLVAVALT